MMLPSLLLTTLLSFQCQALCVYSVDSSGATEEKVISVQDSTRPGAFAKLAAACNALDFDRAGVMASVAEQTYANEDNCCAPSS